MALLENRIEVDLGEATIFTLSEATREALAPPEPLARKLEARPGERGVPESSDEQDDTPAEQSTTNAAAFDEVRLALDAAKVMATPPSTAALDRLRAMIRARGGSAPDA